MLQDRIKKIAQYFRGIEMTGGLFIVKVQYKEKWAAYPTQDMETIKVTRSDEEPNVWFYYAQADTVDMEMIFDLIEETIEMNESVRLKIELLKSKVEELKVLFDTEPLNKLERLEFTFKPEIAEKLKSKRRYNKKKKEDIVVATEENNAEEVNIVE
jgi:hypothetical protein